MNLILILFTMNNFNNDLSVQIYNPVSVQTESLTVFNTESLIDISESVDIGTDIQSNVLPDSLHVDAEVQTKSLWKLFKKSLKKLFCINSSDITPQEVIVRNNVNNLDPSQNTPTNDVISESSESIVQELVEAYDIMDNLSYGIAFSQPNAIFNHNIIDGIHQYFICYSDITLSVNPDLINFFF